jgi:hypothetical protein
MVAHKRSRLHRAAFLTLFFAVIVGLSSCDVAKIFASDASLLSGNYVSQFVAPGDANTEMRVELSFSAGGDYDHTEFTRSAGSNDSWVQSSSEVTGAYTVDLGANTITFTPDGGAEIEGVIQFEEPLLIIQIDENYDGDYEDERETTVYYDTDR